MRLLSRNLSPIWYSLYEGDEMVTTTDEWGNTLMTGEHKVSYADPVKIKVSVSAASGDAQEDMFGTNITYSKVMIVDDHKCPIDENTVLWLDSEPVFDDEGNPVYDYKITAVARSINFVSYAISKREVS
jgi:hypothetical protein